jgi:hypothetical protein
MGRIRFGGFLTPESSFDRWSFTMSCVVRARGANFAVDEFLAASTLKPNAIFRRGQPQWPESSVPSPIPNESGFFASASDADFSDVQGQIVDATNFLERNHDELARLVVFLGVERVCLDFGIAERDVAVQHERFPPKLLKIAGYLGIWLEFTLYPAHEPEADANHD